MRKKTEVRLFMLLLLVLVAVSIGATLAYADSSVSAVSVTWTVAQGQFANLKADDVAKVVCGKDCSLKKVTKSANNGKEIVADVLVMKSN